MPIRDDVLLSMFDPKGFGLEIGPSYNPFLPKRRGFNVETLDYADQEGLKRKYANDPNVDISNIEPVDYISDGRSMKDIIQREGRYDFIFAAHVIEHTPDLLSWLKDCQALLKPDGKLVLVVPDAMSCFDVFRPIVSTGQILDAHLQKRTRHSPGVGFDHIAYMALRGGQAGWWITDGRPITFQNTIEDAYQFFRDLNKTSDYHDLHRWQFTPNSFRLIMNDLAAIGEIGLREIEFFAPQEGYEFYTALSLNGPGAQKSRLELANAILADLKRSPPHCA